MRESRLTLRPPQPRARVQATDVSIERASPAEAPPGRERPAFEPPEPSLFSLHDLSVWYGPKQALAGIEMKLPINRVAALIGPSGCGKSTLLRLIGDLTAPTAGSVEVNGKPAHAARMGREYGMVFQAPVLFEWRTVEENVKLPLELLSMEIGRAHV